MREKTQADFDLERVVDLLDDALMSKDERVMNALRQLLMIVTLTAPEHSQGPMNKDVGPFRQLQESITNLHRRISSLEEKISYNNHYQSKEDIEKLKVILSQQTPVYPMPMPVTNWDNK